MPSHPERAQGPPLSRASSQSAASRFTLDGSTRPSPFTRTRPVGDSSLLGAFNQLAITGHRDFLRAQREQAAKNGEQPSLPPSPPGTPLAIAVVLAPLKFFNPHHTGGLLVGAVLAAIAALNISATSVAMVMLAFGAGLGFLGVGARYLSALTIAKIWCGMMLVGPCCMLLAFSLVLSADEIEKDVAKEAQRRDAVRVVMLLCGGLHASMPLSCLVKLLPASWFSMCASVKTVVMYARLHGAVAAGTLAVGLLNVVGPFWLAFCLVEAMGVAHGVASAQGLDASEAV